MPGKARRLVIPPDTDVAESPPASADPTPQLGELPEQADTPAQEPSPEAAPEQTQSDASGAPEAEPSDPKAGLIEALKPLVESDPELAEALGIRQERPEEDGSEIDLRAFELDQRERDGQIEAFYTQARAQLAQVANPILADWQRDMERAVDDVQQGRADKFDPSSAKLVEFAQTVRDQAEQIGSAKAAMQAEQAARKAFVESPEIRRGLSADERKALPRASFQDLLAMAYNAGQRSAPQAVIEDAKKKAKELTGYEETLKRVKALTGTNGATPRQPEASAAATSFDELEHLYATGEATPEQERKYFAMRQERGL